MESERKKHFERPTSQKPPSLMNLSLLAIFFGLVAGFMGHLMARDVLPEESFNYFSFNNPQSKIELSFDQPLINLYDKNINSIAGVYRSVNTIAAVGVPLFDDNSFLGSAVVVTSDGWLMTTDQVFESENNKVVLGNKIYDIKDTKVDDFAKVVFVKIDADLLQPVNFQLVDEIKEGETLYSLTDMPNSLQHSFDTSILSNSHYAAGQYLFSDSLDYWLDVADKNKDNLLSAPYFNLDGDLIGLSYNLEENNLLIPSSYLQQSVRHLLGGYDRVGLGIRYVDMENNSGFDRKGNLIYHPSLTVLSREAYQAGLRMNDIVLAINNDVIAGNDSITSILQNYRKGDKVIFKILRDNLSRDIEIEL